MLLSLVQTAELAQAKVKANLLVGKELSNSQVVKERDLVIKYTIYNVGDGYVKPPCDDRSRPCCRGHRVPASLCTHACTFSQRTLGASEATPLLASG